MRDNMGKLTKTEKKRLITAIEQKTKKLYMQSGVSDQTVTASDMEAIHRLCKKWGKRAGII